jgi:hypothetical protein
LIKITKKDFCKNLLVLLEDIKISNKFKKKEKMKDF